MPALARVFNISVESLLSGDLSVDESKGDTVKNANFYVCSQCGNIASSTTDMELLCCGKRLSSLKSEKPDNEHQLEVQLVEGEYHLQSEHPMLKEHHFSFIALVSPDLLLVKRLYPEWNLDVRLPQLPWATLYWYCGEHGLFSQKLNIK
jgi:desulfoferrodoxin (superoxide reductase-like protein)